MNAAIEQAKKLLEEAYGVLDRIDAGTTSIVEDASVEATARESPVVETLPLVLKKGEISYTGTVGRPDLRHTRNGKAIWTAGIGVGNGDGTNEWINVKAWGDLAERCDRDFAKGDTVTIIGKPGVERYTDRDGVLVEREIITLSHIDWAEEE